MELKKIYDYIIENNGATTQNNNIINDQKGFVYSLQGFEQKINLKDFNFKTFYKINNKYNNFVKYLNIKELNVGYWIDNNIVYIDISRIVKDKNTAIIQGIKNNQKAIFDLQENKSIYLKDFKKYTIKLKNKYINLSNYYDLNKYIKKYNLNYYIDNTTNKRKNVKKYTYILYTYNKNKNDFNYIAESENLKDFEGITKRSLKNLYRNIHKSIEKITNYNDKYLIIKECL